MPTADDVIDVTPEDAQPDPTAAAQAAADEAQQLADEAFEEARRVREAAAIDVRPSGAVAKTLPGTDLGIIPAAAEMDALAQLAVTLSAAAAVPDALRNKPNDVLLILLTARDVGVALTTAIREFHIIDGKVTLSPKVKLAMVRQHGHGKVYPHQAPRMVVDTETGEERRRLCPCGAEDGPNDDARATWHAERADEPGILHTSTFTLEMAARVRAKEGGKVITLAEKSTWKQYPQRMLSWRALGYLLDDVFSEVGTGLYSPDELGAVTDEEGAPIIDVIGQASPLAGTVAPRGHGPKAEAEDPPASAEFLDDLEARIKALPAPAVAEVRALWTREREDGTPNLPAFRTLRARQQAKADGLVKSIEARAAKGEWADAVDASAAEEAAQAPQAPSDEAPAPDAPPDPVDDEDGNAEDGVDVSRGTPAGLDDDAVGTRELIDAEVARLDLSDVRAKLADIGLPNNDGPQALRLMLRTAWYVDHDAATEAEQALVIGILTGEREA